jgi:hypothetical protein
MANSKHVYTSDRLFILTYLIVIVVPFLIPVFPSAETLYHLTLKERESTTIVMHLQFLLFVLHVLPISEITTVLRNILHLPIMHFFQSGFKVTTTSVSNTVNLCYSFKGRRSHTNESVHVRNLYTILKGLT